jgi:GT2 family glycosyltransferase
MSANAVVIPSYNRPGQLVRCLEAVIVQDIDDFEVVVVDDGSPTPLSDICATFGDRVRCIRQDNTGPAAARNLGARNSTAAFLAFTDDDCRPRPNWLSALLSVHGGDDRRLVGGLVVNGLPDDPFASASQALCDYLYDYFGAANGNMPFFTSNNIGMSRKEFEHIGGFDEQFKRSAAEDRDFGIRWRDAGGTLVYSELAVVDHYHAMTFAKYWRQHSQYGAGARRLHQIMEKRACDLPKLEPLGFYSGLVAWPVKTGGARRLHVSLLMALSQIAMINGYFSAARQANSLGVECLPTQPEKCAHRRIQATLQHSEQGDKE